MKGKTSLILACVLTAACLTSGCSAIKNGTGKLADKIVEKELSKMNDEAPKDEAYTKEDNNDKAETSPQTEKTAADTPESAAAEETEKDYSGLVESILDYSKPGNPDGRHDDYTFQIPKINIDTAEVQEINNYFNDRWNGFCQSFQSASDYNQLDCDSTRYSWWVNDGLLTILYEEDLWPNASGWTELYVYTIDIDNGKVLKPDYFVANYFTSQDEYNNYVRNALGNKFCNIYGHAFNNGAISFYDDFTQKQFTRTIADENIANTIPYLNENKEICLKADIFSLAAGDHYPHLIDKEGMQENALYAEWRQTNMPDLTPTDIKKTGDSDKAVTINKPDGTNNTANTTTAENKTSDTTGSKEYILPESNSRYLTSADITGLSSNDIQLAINEIYARRGRMFNSADVRAYFESKSWYNGTISPEAFSESVFNDYERKNIDFLSRFR